MTATPGTSLDESLRLGQHVAGELRKLPYVRSISQRAGRAEKGEETRGTNASEIDMDLTQRGVPLQRLARIHETSGRSSVLHDGGRRAQTVTGSVEGRSVNSFVAEARAAIDSTVALPVGTYIEFTGSAESEARSRRDLLVHAALAGIGVVVLLSIVMGNYRDLPLVLLNLPFPLVGGVLIALATGGVLSIGSMVGFVTIFGIRLRNSVMMISHFEHLVSVKGMSWGVDTALRGAGERLAPIVITASVTGLGLLPLAVASGTAGREIEGPMAVVILGGLVTSTLRNLLLQPTLALRFGRFGGSSPR